MTNGQNKHVPSGNYNPLLWYIIKQPSVLYNVEVINPPETSQGARSSNFPGNLNGNRLGKLLKLCLDNLYLPPSCYILKTKSRKKKP